MSGARTAIIQQALQQHAGERFDVKARRKRPLRTEHAAGTHRHFHGGGISETALGTDDWPARGNCRAKAH